MICAANTHHIKKDDLEKKSSVIIHARTADFQKVFCWIINIESRGSSVWGIKIGTYLLRMKSFVCNDNSKWPLHFS